MEPVFRSGTKKAIVELSAELNLHYDLNMQDWSYEVSNPKEIEKYISCYKISTDDDKKFVLMEMIIQAIVDQPNELQLLNYWKIVTPLLLENFKIHEFNIHYWKELSKDNFDNCKILNPLLIQHWNSKAL